MENLLQFSNEIRSFTSQHMPPEAMQVGAALAGAVIVLGVLVSVLGAKMARPALTLAFVLLGVAASRLFADRFAGYEGMVSAIGAIAGGVIGFLLYRLWVGAFVAGIFACLTIAFMTSDRIVPALQQLDRTSISTASGAAAFVLPDPSQADRYGDLSFGEAFKRVWEQIKAQDPSSNRRLGIFTVIAGLMGFALGIIAVRLMLILCTAAVGTAMVLSGCLFLSQGFWPDLMDQAIRQERVILLAALAFPIASMVLQSQLTRRPKAAPAKPVTA